MNIKKKALLPFWVIIIFLCLIIVESYVVDHDTTLTEIDPLSTVFSFSSQNANHIWNNNSFDIEDTTTFLYIRDTGLPAPNNWASSVVMTEDGSTMSVVTDVRQTEGILSNTGCYVPNTDSHLVYTRDAFGTSWVDSATSSLTPIYGNLYNAFDEGNCDFIGNQSGNYRACIDSTTTSLVFYIEEDHTAAIYAPAIVPITAYLAPYYDGGAPTVDINENSSSIIISATNQSFDQNEELEIYICETAAGECNAAWNPTTLYVRPSEIVDSHRCNWADNDVVECVYDNATNIKYVRYNYTSATWLNGSAVSSELFDNDEFNTDGGNRSYFPVMNTLDNNGAIVYWKYFNQTPAGLIPEQLFYRMVNYSEGRRYWATIEEIVGSNETQELTTGQGQLGSYVAQGLNTSSLTNYQILRDQCIDNDGDGYNVTMRGCGEYFDCNDSNATWIPLENNTDYSFAGFGETYVFCRTDPYIFNSSWKGTSASMTFDLQTRNVSMKSDTEDGSQYAWLNDVGGISVLGGTFENYKYAHYHNGTSASSGASDSDFINNENDILINRYLSGGVSGDNLCDNCLFNKNESSYNVLLIENIEDNWATNNMNYIILENSEVYCNGSRSTVLNVSHDLIGYLDINYLTIDGCYIGAWINATNSVRNDIYNWKLTNVTYPYLTENSNSIVDLDINYWNFSNSTYGLYVLNSNNSNNAIHFSSNNGSDIEYSGFNISDSQGVSLFSNIITNTGTEAIVTNSTKNSLVWNNLFNSTGGDVYSEGSTITWNIVKTLATNIVGNPYIGGNFWRTYTEDDTDGDYLGNTPYNITGGTEQDDLPLTLNTTFTNSVIIYKPLFKNYTHTINIPLEFETVAAVSSCAWSVDGGIINHSIDCIGGVRNNKRIDVDYNQFYNLILFVDFGATTTEVYAAFETNNKIDIAGTGYINAIGLILLFGIAILLLIYSTKAEKSALQPFYFFSSILMIFATLHISIIMLREYIKFPSLINIVNLVSLVIIFAILLPVVVYFLYGILNDILINKKRVKYGEDYE